MDVWSSLAISLLLLVTATVMMIAHVRTWRAAQGEQVDDAERDYRRRQFRRRMQTSAMLAILGVAIFFGQLLIFWIGSWQLAVFYWLGILLMVLWLALLAVADIVATKFHFSRQRRDFMVEQARLQAELRRMEAPRRNGQARKKS